jgi:hypothetical protein
MIYLVYITERWEMYVEADSPAQAREHAENLIPDVMDDPLASTDTEIEALSTEEATLFGDTKVWVGGAGPRGRWTTVREYRDSQRLQP